MALTSEGRALTEAQRLRQAPVGARAAAEALETWGLLDLSNLDASMAAWLPVQVSRLRDQRAESQSLAERYVVDFRAAEVGERTGPVVKPAFNEPLAVASMRLSGPIAVKTLIRGGMAPEVAFDQGRRAVAGLSQKWALFGGRDVVRESAKANRQSRGFRRVASGVPCAFCAMLVTRDITRGDFRRPDFKAHEHCRCVAEEVFGPQEPTDDEAAWIDAYNEAAKQARAAGEPVVAPSGRRRRDTVLWRMRRNQPALFRDGVVVTT